MSHSYAMRTLPGALIPENVTPGRHDGPRDAGKGTGMLDWDVDLVAPHPLMPQLLGLAIARRAADILERHRDVLTRPGSEHDRAQFAADDAIFTAVLDAVNECLGEFDPGRAGESAEDRWCDALLQLIRLARLPAGLA